MKILVACEESQAVTIAWMHIAAISFRVLVVIQNGTFCRMCPRCLMAVVISKPVTALSIMYRAVGI